MVDGPGFEDHFEGDDVDPAVWLPHYLPAWSSRAATAATYQVRDSCLTLSVPPAHGLWLAGEHSPDLRVSGVQSGNWSGPVGSGRGQQPWGPDAVVREQQEPFRGWTPAGGRLEMRARGVVTGRSMVAWWLVGFEEEPEECAEICVMEVFGDAVEPGTSAAVGMGLHAFRDPRVREDFATPRVPIDIEEFHTYAVEWTPRRVDFFVDDRHVRGCPDPPAYPMQTMLAVFDFPGRGGDAEHVPMLVVDYLRGDELT